MKLRTYDVIVAAKNLLDDTQPTPNGFYTVSGIRLEELCAALAKIPSPLPVKMTKTEIRDRMEPETPRRKIFDWDSPCRNCEHPFHAHYIRGGQGFCTWHISNLYTGFEYEDCDCGGFQPE